MATDFYVYHSDGTYLVESVFEAEVQVLIPALDAEEGGAASVIELDPAAPDFALPAGHDGADVLGNTLQLFPSIVASRSGVVIRIVNFTSAAQLAPATILGPGGDLNETVLDGLEAQTQAASQAQEEQELRQVEGNAELISCNSALLGGDVLTPDLERGCFFNLVRSELGLPTTKASKYVAQTDVDIFEADTDGITESGIGGNSTQPAIQHADFPQLEGFMRKIGVKQYEAVKSNLVATVAPTVGNDDTEGYAVGSIWIDNTGGVDYLCADASTGAAVWLAHGAPGGGEANDAENVGAGAGVYKDKSGVNVRLRSITTPGDEIAAAVSGDGNEVELSIGSGATLGSLANVDPAVDTADEGSHLVLLECPPGTKTWRPLAGGGGGGGSGPSTFAALLDTDFVGLVDGNLAVYEASSGTWIPFTTSALSSEINHAALQNLAVGDPHTQYQLISEKGAANGYADLDVGGKVPAARIPAVALPEVHVVADATARLALTVQEGDEAIQLDDGSHWIYDGTTWHLRPGNTAQNNTASNVNAGGVGVFKQKTGVDLEFRGINAGSAKIVVALDGANNEIDVDVDPSEIDVGDLAGTPLPDGRIAKASSTITRTLATYAVVPGMTITPGAGTYFAIFSSHAYVDKNGRKGFFAIFTNGVEDTESVRRVGGKANNEQGFSCMAEVTVGDGEAIDARWKLGSAAAAPTLTAGARTLYLLKVE